MRLGMMVSLGMLGVAALAGCQSSHPTTKPSIGSDDCDCCPPAAPAAELREDRVAAAFAEADAASPPLSATLPG